MNDKARFSNSNALDYTTKLFFANTTLEDTNLKCNSTKKIIKIIGQKLLNNILTNIASINYLFKI